MVKMNKLSLYDHVRREDDSVIKVALNMKVTRKRLRGRPRLRWINNISSHLEEENTSLKDLLTKSVRQARIPALPCVTLQYDRLDFLHFLRSPFKLLLLIIIHYVEPLVIYGCHGE